VRAVILAAGAGSRLRPLTERRPKCMVELGGLPLLHRQLSVLRGAGIDDISVVVGAHADAVDAPGATLVTNPSWQRSNMVASLFCARETLQRGHDVVIAYGDIAYEPRILAALLESAGPLAVVVDRGWRTLWERRFDDPLEDAETLRLRPDGTIAELGRRPRSLDEVEGQYIGLIKLSAAAASDAVAHHDRLAAADPEAVARMYMTDFIQSLIDHGWPVRAASVDHGWIEIDTPADAALYDGGALRDLYDDRGLLVAQPTR
jgi:choline kinase